MSYVRSTIQFPDRSHGFSSEEAEKLTVEEFDKLPLSDQMHLYNNHRSVYDRLTGKTPPITTPTAEEIKAKQFADEFEQRVEDAIRNAFHPNEGKNHDIF